MLKIYAPATSANLSAGFDSLGIAVSPIDGSLLGDLISIEKSNQVEFALEGKFCAKLPKNLNENIIYQAYVLFNENLRLKGMSSKKFKMTLAKNMPIGSGLGSSACSAVGALVALNEFHNNAFNQDELILMMGEIEGRISGAIHYDNIAPCYLGGLHLMTNTNKISYKLPEFDWFWVFAYSGIEVKTADARRILPPHYSMHDSIIYAQRMAGFVHACHSQDQILAAACMQDIIAEPYRCQLLPNYNNVRQQSLDLGAISCGISGSGPTMFACANDLSIANLIAQNFKTNYLQNEDGFVSICKIDQAGARVLS